VLFENGKGVYSTVQKSGRDKPPLIQRIEEAGIPAVKKTGYSLLKRVKLWGGKLAQKKEAYAEGS